jgi:hypothetical protein
MKTTMLILALFLSISAANAVVSVEISGYNDEDEMSVSMDGSNLNYDGAFSLYPDGISYLNSGESSFDECDYSFSMTFNGRTLSSSSETDSGAFGWKASMLSDQSDEEGKSNFGLSGQNMVKDGELSTAFGNSDQTAQELVKANGAQFVEQFQIDDASMDVNGKGATKPIEISQPIDDPDPDYEIATIEMKGSYESVKVGPVGSQSSSQSDSTSSPTNSLASTNLPNTNIVSTIGPSSSTNNQNPPSSDDNLDQGFSQDIDSNGNGNWAHIFTNIQGQTQSNWITQIKCIAPDDLSLGMQVLGVSKNGKDTLYMEGQAPNIPKQILPPGDIVVTTQTNANAIDISKEGQDFYNEYPASTETKPVSWYSFDNRGIINPIMDGASGASTYTPPQVAFYGMQMAIQSGNYW